MRRRRLPILRMLIALLLGLVSTTAVAWTVALRGIGDDAYVTADPVVLITDERSEFGWYFSPPTRGFGWTCILSSVRDVSVITPTAVRAGGRVRQIPDDGRFWYKRVYSVPNGRRLPPRPISFRREFHFGWPFRAFWAASDKGLEDDRGTVLYTHPRVLHMQDCNPLHPSPFIVLSGDRRGGWAVPTGVLAAGLLGDVFIHAAAWWVVLFMPAAVRKRSRMRRNLCPHCAYDLSGTGAGMVCPECGRAGT